MEAQSKSDPRPPGKSQGVLCQTRHSRSECGEPFVVRLPSHISEIDLLNYDSDLEQRESLIKGDPGQVAAGLFGIALGHFSASQPPGSRSHGADGFPPRFRIVFLGPVTKQDAEIDQWIAYSAHLPIQHRYDAGRVFEAEHHVVELEIVMYKSSRPSHGRIGLGWNALAEPLHDLVHFWDFACFGALPSLVPSLNLPRYESDWFSKRCQSAAVDIHIVQSGKSVDHGFADSPPRQRIITYLGRLFSSDDDPAPPLHQIKRHAYDR